MRIDFEYVYFTQSLIQTDNRGRKRRNRREERGEIMHNKGEGTNLI